MSSFVISSSMDVFYCATARSIDVYQNPRNGKKAPGPRHDEIKDGLADLIKKQLEI